MLDPLRVNSLSKADTQKKLQLISTIANVIYMKDEKLSTRLAKDLNKMIPNY